MSDLQKLIGKRINGIFLNEDATNVVFRCVGGEYLGFYVSGDCCNTVYINHFQGNHVVGNGNSFDLIRGALVLGTEEKEWVSIDAGDEEDIDGWAADVVEDGFFTIKTDRGYIDFEVRNEHNGYYSGHIHEWDDLNEGHLAELVPLKDF